jgi:transketolase
MNTRPQAMRDAFLEKIFQAMAFDEKIFFVSADFGSPVLDKIRSEFPKRFINVGIAEQNLINICAGLATEGFKVFAYAIAPFITMRCYEQIRVNLVLLSVVRKMNVTLIGVGAGYSYVVSGPTHQCYEDISIMRALPTMAIYSPADSVTASHLFETCLENDGPKYLRLDAQVLPVIYTENTPNIAQGFHELRSGHKICLLATGYMVHTALKVAENLQKTGLNVGIIDIFDITNFNSKSLKSYLKHYEITVTLEEGFRGRGGLDAKMFDWVAEHRVPTKILNIGVEGSYKFELGSRSELHEQVGIGTNIVTEKIINFLKIEEQHEISINEK